VSTVAIDINDAGLVLADSTAVIAVEPGYALLDGKQIVTGEAALRQARLRPRLVSNRYWAELGTESGSSGLEGIETAAELAYAQLDTLWKRFGRDVEAAVLVVPGHYGREQLGLLLGLAQECGIPVRSMVNAAVAASFRPYPGRQVLHVDAGLHRIAVTPIEQGERAAAGPEQGVDALGLARLTDQWARRVAELFVLATRFDPFHHADSEQRLYDQLPQWLQLLEQNGTAELTLSHNGEEFTVEAEREQVLGVADGFYRALVQLIAQQREGDAGLVVQLSDRLARLAGLINELERLDDAQVVPLEPGRAARGALMALDELAHGEQVKLLKHVAWREQPAEQPARRPRVRAAAPRQVLPATHIVHRGIVMAVGSEGLMVGRAEVEGRRTIVIDERHGGVSRRHCELALRDGELKLIDSSRHGTFVNERRVSGEVTLHPADIIRIGSPGEELYVVRLEG
jgi:hypothetical protein